MSAEYLKLIVDEAALCRHLTAMPLAGLLAIIGVCVYLLMKGADWTIEGAVGLAVRTGLPRIVIGATIVSLGTTLPEAFVSVLAAWMGNPGLALGNGVGSIIADTGLIFGITCLLARVPIDRYILNRTGWVQVSMATLLVVIALVESSANPQSPVLNRWVGFLFLALLAGYMYITYLWARQSDDQPGSKDPEGNENQRGIPVCCTMIFSGLALVIVSARILVPSASTIALRFGVPEDVIAATMVAFGTSLPELMTAFAAVRKGHPEIMVGNIVGADVLNCLFVIGAAAAVKPLQIPPNFYHYHFPVMLAILYSFRIFIGMGNKQGVFKRWHGAWLMGIYLVYVVMQYRFSMA